MGCIESRVAELSPSVTRGMPEGFRSAPTALPWTDHRFVGPEAETCEIVRQARPWTLDDNGVRHDLVITFAEVNLIGHGIALGWVQVHDFHRKRPFDIALDMLMQKKF